MGGISRVATLITHIQGLTSPVITTHEPPSRPETLYPYRIPIDAFTGTLKGTLITTHEPPSIEFGFIGHKSLVPRAYVGVSEKRGP